LPFPFHDLTFIISWLSNVTNNCLRRICEITILHIQKVSKGFFATPYPSTDWSNGALSKFIRTRPGSSAVVGHQPTSELFSDNYLFALCYHIFRPCLCLCPLMSRSSFSSLCSLLFVSVRCSLSLSLSFSFLFALCSLTLCSLLFMSLLFYLSLLFAPLCCNANALIEYGFAMNTVAT
jgi:hypothetical protein